MLLKEYILLNQGAAPTDEVERWKRDMIARRQADACRDLLTRWRPAPDQIAVLTIMGRRRFMGEMSEAELRAGLEQTAQAVMERYSLAAPAVIDVQMHGSVAFGQITLTPGPIDHRAVGNALAYHFEQAFGYAQASKHPVAYEESLRPPEEV